MKDFLRIFSTVLIALVVAAVLAAVCFVLGGCATSTPPALSPLEYAHHFATGEDTRGASSKAPSRALMRNPTPAGVGQGFFGLVPACHLLGK